MYSIGIVTLRDARHWAFERSGSRRRRMSWLSACFTRRRGFVRDSACSRSSPRFYDFSVSFENFRDLRRAHEKTPPPSRKRRPANSMRRCPVDGPLCLPLSPVCSAGSRAAALRRFLPCALSRRPPFRIFCGRGPLSPQPLPGARLLRRRRRLR